MHCLHLKLKVFWPTRSTQPLPNSLPAPTSAKRRHCKPLEKQRNIKKQILVGDNNQQQQQQQQQQQNQQQEQQQEQQKQQHQQ